MSDVVTMMAYLHDTDVARHVTGQRRTSGACCRLLGTAALTFLSSDPWTTSLYDFKRVGMRGPRNGWSLDLKPFERYHLESRVLQHIFELRPLSMHPH